MAIDPNLLDSFLALPTTVALSDADALTAVNTPTITPLNTPITITSLGDAWGATRAAAVYAALQTLAASSDPNAPLAAMVIAVLSGPGFLPSNAQSQSTIATLVTAGICTQDEAVEATCTTTYIAGDVATLDDVQAGRARLAYTAAAQALYAAADAPWNTANDLRNSQYAAIQALVAGNATLPSDLSGLTLGGSQ